MTMNPESVTDVSIERYTIFAYLKDHAGSLLILISCLFFLALILPTLGIGVAGIIIILGLVTLSFFAMAHLEYHRRAPFFNEAGALVDQLIDSRHFTSLMEEPTSLEGRVAYQVIERILDILTNEVDDARAESEGYRSYVELWIHEIKTPIATSKLALADMHGPEAARLSREMERIEAEVDQALYYARSLSLTNDYTISELELAEVIREVCRKNAYFLIENGTTPLITVANTVKVFSDRPWLVFMISQVVVNASKYGATTITFSSQEIDPNTPHGCTVLSVADNGIGIDAADTPRVFNRGFTGKNGRAVGSATGMGLYLVAEMAERMGIGVSLSSEPDIGTTVEFSFPHDRRRLSR